MLPRVVATATAPAAFVTWIAANEADCPDTTTRRIYVAPNSLIRVPNAFSPNGDNLNDIFYIIDIGIVDLIEFKIYNRWGELVFSTSEIDQGWDGNFRGKPQDVGTFVYYIVATTSESPTENVIKGSFSLIR